MNRREFLKAALFSSAFMMPGIQAWAFKSGTPSEDQKKLIAIFLRGGIDGLNVVVPHGDQHYYSIRPNIAVAKPGSELGAIDLDGYFGLHPSLAPLLPVWQEKTLAFVHSSGSPDPTRSHFDAQDYMESGLPGQRTASTGWLNRLVSQLPPSSSPVRALSVGPVLPRILAGPARVATVERVGQHSYSAVDRPVIGESFAQMYEGRNDDLGKAYSEAISAHQTINKAMDEAAAEDANQREQMMANRGAPVLKGKPQFGSQLASLFRKEPQTQVAFIDFGGWDTHVNEGSGKGQLANKLTALSGGLADLIQGLGPLYKNTTIVVMSEFGRTARENGNGGTDHGHGNVMWLMGGSVEGGKVYGHFQGLAPNQLHEDRDLPTSTDFRSVLSYMLNEHMEVPKVALQKVFPDFELSGNPFKVA